jgi:hypothetical protein
MYNAYIHIFVCGHVFLFTQIYSYIYASTDFYIYINICISANLSYVFVYLKFDSIEICINA